MKDTFLAKVADYKASIEYGRRQSSRIKRFLYNFNKFGIPYVRYQLSRLGIPQPFPTVRAVVFDRQLVLPARDVGSHILNMYGILPERSERRLALWLINNVKKEDAFYDIGSHMGYYTALCQSLIKTGEIHAFEANSKLSRYLIRNFSNSKNVHVVPAAVTSSPGPVDFYEVTDEEGSSIGSRFPISGSHTALSQVSGLSIDDYVAVGHKPPTIIKLDIEGGEYDAIVGALGTISRCTPTILMEVWGGEQGRKYSLKAVEKLEELGYVAYLVGSDNLINDPVGEVSRSSGDSRDNFLFIKK